jgi:GrpB-like predicted nucleotidyltransferase (UPF0157 family)
MPEIDEPVEVWEYQSSWPGVFNEERRCLSSALNVPGEGIEHIGSTSVAGLAAKPTIDLMLGVDEMPPAAQFLRGIERQNWEAVGEAGVPGRLYFRKRQTVDANLHVVLRNGAHWINNLAIRNYLRTSADARRHTSAKRRALNSGA